MSFAPEGGDDPVPCDPRLDVEGQSFECREDLLGGLLGVETQLGLAVDVAAERDDLLSEILFDLLLKSFELLGHVHEVSSHSGLGKVPNPRWSASQPVSFLFADGLT